MSEIIIMSDPRVSAIPVEESGEPLVDLRAYPELLLDRRLADPAGAYAHLRQGLAERLLAAQKLLPHGLRFLVVEGYRPYTLQEQYFTAYAGRLRDANPDWPEDHLYVQTSRSLSPPHIAPHVCGAAVDLTLCTAAGDELPMGTEVNASPEESDDACYTAAANVSAEARANREILSSALTGAGFVNYPTEWWHWSYGDRYWALNTGAAAARYAHVNLLPTD
ncbi:M15 family metallopeptidase [Sphaerisporangium perillae]|uniref:M15 family metallopeptidase n=1 Tax=Sphaerisporangium perillae TaxID=2935860 RepID=UPI00200FC0FF|nr:M15 family metallopeptidase [Sphaerisporangium perillae]